MIKTFAWAGFGVLFVGIVAGCSATAQGEDAETSEAALSPSCDAVKCALPLCAQGQHLSYQGSCCPTCVGPEPKCAAVTCIMMMCAIGEQLVTPKGQCCPRCVAVAPVAECTVDTDCPSYACFACPCPVSKCVGRKCQTSTPDASTCSSTP